MYFLFKSNDLAVLDTLHLMLRSAAEGPNTAVYEILLNPIFMRRYYECEYQVV